MLLRMLNAMTRCSLPAALLICQGAPAAPPAAPAPSSDQDLFAACMGGASSAGRPNPFFIEEFNSAGAGHKFVTEAALMVPMSLAFDAEGNLYVGDGGGTIEEFNPAGIGHKFNVIGDVSCPCGLAFDADGNFFVTNFSERKRTGGKGKANYGFIEEFNSVGVGHKFNVSGTVSNPQGLAIDAAGNLYIANFNGTDDMIEEFNSAGVGHRFNVSGDVYYSHNPHALAFRVRRAESPSTAPE